jgi:hypothetical protein
MRTFNHPYHSERGLIFRKIKGKACNIWQGQLQKPSVLYKVAAGWSSPVARQAHNRYCSKASFYF